jgi:hypothetical protein
MKIVSEESIESAIDLIEAMSEDDFAAFAKSFTETQPALASYIFVHEEEFSDEDFDLIANLALTIYKSYEIECGKPMTLTSEEVEAAAMQQMDYLDAIETASEEEMEALVEKAFDGTQQPVLLDFAAHELHVMESEGAIEHESGGALIYPILQLVVDLLHKAFNGSRLQIS